MMKAGTTMCRSIASLWMAVLRAELDSSLIAPVILVPNVRVGYTFRIIRFLM
jgi:hypothetical protein